VLILAEVLGDMGGPLHELALPDDAVGGGIIQLDTASESAIWAQPGYSGSPVIVSGDAGDEVIGILAVTGGGGPARDIYAIPVSELARAWPDVVGRLTIPACPYRGLGAFTADDGDVFVGREDQVARLRDMVCIKPLVVVTGPSGVGKSSLVNAGLIPMLRNQGWVTGAFRPGAMPVDALARALVGAQKAGQAADGTGGWQVDGAYPVRGPRPPTSGGQSAPPGPGRSDHRRRRSPIRAGPARYGYRAAAV
jgi:hypothetical protein